MRQILEGIISLIEALITWPSLFFYIAIKYHKEFRAILNRLESAKFGDAEISLSKKQTEKAIDKTLEEFSKDIMTPIIQSLAPNEASNTNKKRYLKNNNGEINTASFSVQIGDVDGDGRDEFVISSMEGLYWCRVRIFKPILEFREQEIKTYFEMIGEICPVNFLEDVSDIDRDAHAEIIVNEDNKSSGLPHAAGHRDRVVYKFRDGQLYEFSREEIPRLNTQFEMNKFAEKSFREKDKIMNDIIDNLLSESCLLYTSDAADE
ncbi:hypothetical protein FLX56_24510 [Synechococcus moorigangaii CMS01]|nr:hypothetical protein [Synechococcus moorigangaii CMS01]